MITVEMLGLFLVVLSVASWQSYRRGRFLGQVEGITASLDHLVEEGYIDVLEAIEVEKKF